jgi:hypothetical protein
MAKLVGERIAAANVADIVRELIELDGAREIRITAVPGEPGFYRIEAE